MSIESQCLKGSFEGFGTVFTIGALFGGAIGSFLGYHVIRALTQNTNEEELHRCGMFGATIGAFAGAIIGGGSLGFAVQEGKLNELRLQNRDAILLEKLTSAVVSNTTGDAVDTAIVALALAAIKPKAPQ